MKTRLHLLAMPLSYPMHPSSQLGYLHAYVEQAFKDEVKVRSYSAFLDVLQLAEGDGMVAFFEKYNLVGEEILFLACCYEASQHQNMRTTLADDFPRVLSLYNRNRPDLKISQRRIAGLSQALEAYLKDKFLPSLEDDCLNVVGFTATFCQVFGSIFAANYIARHSSKHVLFVFGGSSFSLPEATRTLERWGIDGLMVAGSGEVPLYRILEGCIQLDQDQLGNAAAVLDSLDISNVTRVGDSLKPIHLSMPKTFMTTLPDPNYDEFFANLRSHCEDEAAYRYAVSELVSVPLEGSRGCFAKCDFCHNPNITSDFGSLTGRKVAERTIKVCEQYGLKDVTFVDSVCNTWAGEYADFLFSSDKSFASFMEMRAHAPEAFWTRLALSGIRSVQLGVEAISEPLLHLMRKRTRVLQNLSATKYLAELGVESPSNLIINHPKSTVADVKETKRVMSLVEHMPTFLLSYFVVSYASPIYNELSLDRRSYLIRGFDWLPDNEREYSFPRHLSYIYPAEWIDPEVTTAWEQFRDWYAIHSKGVAARRPVFTVERSVEGLRFIDTRFGKKQRYTISGETAEVFDACHVPSNIARLEQLTQFERVAIERILDELEDRSMIVRIGDSYLSLALRPAEELLENLVGRRLLSPTGSAHDIGLRMSGPV